MHISRTQIKNFRNFKSLDVNLGKNTVLIGENRVGKSNFLFAIRLVLDASLPDSARQLKFTDVWDGHDWANSPQVEVHLDFSAFDSDPKLVALLTDFRLADDHNIARLTYLFRKKAEAGTATPSEADFEFKIFGGNEETRNVPQQVRRRIHLAWMDALRDAETELLSWRNSPLRAQLDEAVAKIDTENIKAVSTAVNAATSQITSLNPIKELEKLIRDKISTFSGSSQDIHAKLGVVPTDPLQLFRSIRLLIDDGKRSMSDASLGSANLVLLSLKIAESEWLRQKNDHDYTIQCIEEPEAHIHPQLQRSIFSKLFIDSAEQALSLILTTHSPNIVSVTPLNNLVLLKATNGEGSRGYSLANLALTREEKEDLQRYMNVTRAELLFSTAVIFVEGDSEETLVSVFAKTLGVNLDELGITVCNVGGTHFKSYVSLVCALKLPFSIITDWDPVKGKNPLGIERLITLINFIRSCNTEDPLGEAEVTKLKADPALLRVTAKEKGIFSNEYTLETEVVNTPELGGALLDVLLEAGFGSKRQETIAKWKDGSEAIDAEKMFLMISDIGKGRLSARLAAKAINLPPPTYISEAIRYVSPA